MDLGLVVGLGLAALVLTYLAMDAVIFDRPRTLFMRQAGGRLDALLACPWCTSAYTAAAVVAGADRYGSVPLPVATWFAVWAVAVVAYFAARFLSGD